MEVQKQYEKTGWVYLVVWSRVFITTLEIERYEGENLMWIITIHLNELSIFSMRITNLHYIYYEHLFF